MGDRLQTNFPPVFIGYRSAAIPFINSRPVNWFISPALRDNDTYEVFHQRTVALTALSMSIYGPIFALLYWFVFDIPTVAIGLGIATASWIGALILLRRWGSTLWPSQLICASVTVFLTWAVWKTGGIHSPGAFWFIIVPVLATAYHREQRWAWLWSAVVTIVVGGMVFAAARGDWQTTTAIDSIEHYSILYAASIVGTLVAMVVTFTIRHLFESWLLETTRRREIEKSRAEAELRRAHEKARARSLQSLQALMENSPDGVVVHRGRNIVYANPAFRSLVKSEDTRVEGISLERFVRPEDKEQWERSLEALEKRESLEVRDREVLRCDGSTIPVDIKTFRASFEDKDVLISIVHDLSETRELQAKMMEMDRMIAVGTLASGVAHEINNPLSFVHANLEFLLRRMDTEDGDATPTLFERLSADDIREALLDSLEGTSRIRDIVSDLRTVAPSEKKQRVPMDVEETLEKAIKMASNQIQQRARLIRDFSGLPTIESDESGLAQVFLNLVVNAAQAIAEGAPSDNEIRVSTRQRGRDVVVEISDTGKGISNDDMDRIFDPFFSTKPQGEGMGLGLSICRTTVQELGGRIEVESDVGRGSTFRVIIPAPTTADESREFSVPVDPFEEKEGRVVVIDDEEVLLRSLKRQLGDRFDVETYDNADDALRNLEFCSVPEMILCDLQMPKVSGVEFFHRLQNCRPELVDRVVFITGGVFTREVREFVDRTDHEVLEKPLLLEDLMEVFEGLA